eukprot:CAMPEP_0206372396 /NCGR_PEP_ID=MMETSP0294-20121207/7082_1 /ASSEMBLY_ACC=CAM_ASM_000327 /TAXON_ID=39354 /ORGANISM="Heterosigma akashiwo, Strain CCMP2393" /LENGTH=262 /DNA_ID=CAMNT_0053819763 /DNA_START=171 /DNA_END=959 /DNA_ORIENTATION=-
MTPRCSPKRPRSSDWEIPDAALPRNIPYWKPIFDQLNKDLDVKTSLQHSILSFIDGKTAGSFSWDLAAKNGHLSMIKVFNEVESFQKSQPRKDPMVWASAWGHLDVVKYLHTSCNEKLQDSLVLDLAAANNHLGTAQYLHDQGAPCSHIGMDLAAWRGHLPVVEWLHANRSEGCTKSAMDLAAQEGHLSVVEWLHFNRQEGCTTKAMDQAGLNGHLPVVQFLSLHRREGCSQQGIRSVISRLMQQAVPSQQPQQGMSPFPFC